jgi:hypothetical protein
MLTVGTPGQYPEIFDSNIIVAAELLERRQAFLRNSYLQKI